MKLLTLSPTLEYQKKDSNICCFISLESALAALWEFVYEKTIALWIEEWLIYQYKGYSDRIKFTNAIILDKEQNKG